MSRTSQEVTAFDGTYRRVDGVWCYGATGTAVPGARDLVLGEFYDFPTEGRGRLIPEGVARSDPFLSWCLGGRRSARRQDLIEIPEKEWATRAVAVVGIDAPELQPERLMTVAQVAAITRLSEMSIRRYLVPDRMSMPAPTLYVGATPCWARPIIDQWIERRQARVAAAG